MQPLSCEPELAARMAYWKERLPGESVLIPLFSGHSCSLASVTYGAVLLSFSRALTTRLKLFSDCEGVSLFVTLLTGFCSLLYRYTGQEDIVVGTRTQPDLDAEIDNSSQCFSNTIPLRTDLSRSPSFRELLERVLAVVVGARAHEVPFEDLLRESKGSNNPGQTSVFQVMFSFLPRQSLPVVECHATFVRSDCRPPEPDLHLMIDDGPDGLVGQISYNADIFAREAITRMWGHWQVLLETMMKDPEQRVATSPILTAVERNQLLIEWNDTKAEYSSSCLHEIFEAQAERTPDAVAVVYKGQSLSYQLLNARANQLSHFLRKLGVGPDKLVGVCVERSPELMVALLGILKSGGAYVPLDPHYPEGRLAMMLQDSALGVLVTEEALLGKFPKYPGHLVCLDRDSRAISEQSAKNTSAVVKGDNLAYLIYTSGSTGKPKGVQISRRSLVNFLISMQASPGLAQQDTLLAVTTISFDIAALELYLPLTVGARIVLASREEAADGYQLRELLEKFAPSVMQATPATWRLLLDAGWQGGKDLKVLCGGEAMPRELVLELLTRVKSVWNMYGPTETTVWSTTSLVTSVDAPITIGRPIANTQIYILDKQLQPVPVGVPGELYVGGDGVARGYFQRPDLTAEKFIPNPFCERQSEGRLYRTGDLARYLPSGDIECLGRIDHQVKLRGFRIELGEIESVLSQHPGLRQNVVVAREDALGDKRLVAYVSPSHASEPLTSDALRAFLKLKLPEYMLPSRFIFLESLPLTPNGKVDRKALPSPTPLEFTEHADCVGPQNAIESKLVKIWESVLGIRRVGLLENFFELGGHSLLVAKLLRRIEQTFGIKLSMASIFAAPTIKQQAFMLRTNSTSQRHTAVVPVQPLGSKPPLFCFGFNAGPVFLPLARRLGPDQPLLGVDPTLMQDSELSAPFSMESIAATLVKQIRELQFEGPYYLGGFCAGGLMAFETATQLMALGQQVALLALFEPQTPADYDPHSNGSRAHALGQKLTFHFHNLQQLRFKEGRLYYQDRARVFRDRVKALLQNVFPSMQQRRNDGKSRNLGHTADFSVIYRDYRPQPFPGPVTLFQATDRPSWRGWHNQYWRRLSASLDVHLVPGSWNWVPRFFLEPNVQILANELNERLG